MTEQRKRTLCALAIVLGVAIYAAAMTYAVEMYQYNHPAHQCRPQRVM